jgi:low temperature requirement protein LtrA
MYTPECKQGYYIMKRLTTPIIIQFLMSRALYILYFKTSEMHISRKDLPGLR